MKKIFTSFLLVTISLISAMADNVAKIGETEYATLRLAIEDAHKASNDVTITMLQDVEDTEAKSIEIKNDAAAITLDLNGKRIVMTSGNIIVTNKLNIVNSGEGQGYIGTGKSMTLFNVKGQLNIETSNFRLYSASGTIFVNEGATLNIDGKTEDTKALDYYNIESRKAAGVENHGTATVKNVKMLATGMYGRCFLGIKGTMTIENVTGLTTYWNVLKLDPDCGDVTVTGGYFECQNFSGTINNSSKSGTLTLNNLQCYNKNVDGWNYNDPDHRALYGEVGSKTIINGGKYWSDINQAIKTSGDLEATDMTITTRPLRGGANSNFKLTNCNISVGNFTAIDLPDGCASLEINGGQFSSSKQIVSIPGGTEGEKKAVTIKNATMTSTGATVIDCDENLELTLDGCTLNASTIAVNLSDNNDLILKDCKVKGTNPIVVPTDGEEEKEEVDPTDHHVTVSFLNTVFAAEPDASIIPAGYMSFRNTDPETAEEYPYAIVTVAQAFEAYKTGAAAYARGLKNNTDIDATLENIATQIEAMSYDETKSYEEQVAAIEELLGDISGLNKAQIGETQYLSLREAVTAANASEEDVTISLLNSFSDNVSEAIEINNANGKKISLDLKGKSMTFNKYAFNIHTDFEVLNSEATASTVKQTTKEIMFLAKEGLATINGENCTFTNTAGTSAILGLIGTGKITCNKGRYTATNGTCVWCNSDESVITLNNVYMSSTKNVTIRISRGKANLDNTEAHTSGAYNAIYAEGNADNVDAKNSKFYGTGNASVVKIYSKNGKTFSMDKCTVDNTYNAADATKSSSRGIYADAGSHIIMTNGCYVHAKTQDIIETLGTLEANGCNFNGFYGINLYGKNATATLVNCNVTAKNYEAVKALTATDEEKVITITGGAYKNSASWVLQFAAGHKVTIDGISTSSDNGILVKCPATIKNSTLSTKYRAVSTDGETAALTLQDCMITAGTPVGGNDKSVTCEGKVIANNVIDETKLIGSVCGANTDEDTKVNYPYIAMAGTDAFDEYRASIKEYIEEYKTVSTSEDFQATITTNLNELDAMSYNSEQIFAEQAAAMLGKAKNVACKMMDLCQGEETAESVVEMVALVKENINAAVNTEEIELAKNDGKNAIIDARTLAVEAAKTAALEAIDQAVGENTEAAVLDAANTAKENINAAITTGEVETAKTNGVKAVEEAISAGIVNVNAAVSSKAVIYTIGGTRLSKVSKSGLYIIDNRKVFIRK